MPKVNALAERSPGFVWRSGTEAELASAAGWPLFVGNDRLIASFSVWESPEAPCAPMSIRPSMVLSFRRAEEWFDPDATRGHALWWVQVGHVPSITEAREKVEALEAGGASDAVFNLRAGCPPPDRGGGIRGAVGLCFLRDRAPKADSRRMSAWCYGQVDAKTLGA